MSSVTVSFSNTSHGKTTLMVLSFGAKPTVDEVLLRLHHDKACSASGYRVFSEGQLLSANRVPQDNAFVRVEAI